MFGIDDIVEGAITATIGPLFTRLIDLIPDPAEKARQAALIQQKLMDADAAMIAQQNAINLAQATNSNLFVSGPRPAIMWVCAGGFAWAVVIQPFLSFGLNAFDYHPALPVLDSSLLMAMTTALLGLGTMKSYERVNGVSNEGQKPTQTLVVRPSQAVMNLPSGQ